MGNRRKAREIAMQALFFIDMAKTNDKENIKLFCDTYTPPKKVLPFFYKLIEGVISQKSEIDSIIDRFSNNWKINRMSCVDRNIIRIAVYELLFCDDIPSKVSINEAIDIGKRYSTDDSGAFINGVLDAICNKLKQKDKTENVK